MPRWLDRGAGVVLSLTCPCRSREPRVARRRICVIASNLYRPVLCPRIAARPAFDLAYDDHKLNTTYGPIRPSR